VLFRSNNLRQLILAIHNFAAENHGRLPAWDGMPSDAKSRQSLYRAILPELEQGQQFPASAGTQPVAVFINPADPSYDTAVLQGLASYAANSWVFENTPRLPQSIPDGTSQTLGFAEHYAACQQPDGQTTRFAWTECANTFPYVPATFGWKDPERTFQVVLPLNGCSSPIAQTPHRGGMLTALMDGSVRILYPSMSYATYWRAVTPAGGETLGPDW